MKMAALILALLLAAAPAAAQPDPAATFCRDLRRVIEAAEQEGGFAALEVARPTPPRLGFDHGCQATGDERQRYWVCSQNFAPESMGVEAMAARVAGCLPDAVRGGRTMYREASFTLPHAEIRLYEHGGPGAHVGRMVELVVESKPEG